MTPPLEEVAADERRRPAPLVLLLSGPNLNLLGEREPEIYGTATLDDHVARGRRGGRRRTGSTLEHLQSNHEGDLVDAVHGARGRVRGDRRSTPVRFTHYAWALHDALAAFDGPVVELHLSNPQRPRGVAAHVGGRAGGHRHDRRVRRRRLPAGGRGGRRAPAGVGRPAGPPAPCLGSAPPGRS